MGRWPPFFSHWASLAEVVVLPEPWRPAMRTTDGGWEAVRNFAVSLPRRLMSSSWTMLTICSDGERAVVTSVPRALARMCSMRVVDDGEVDVGLEKGEADLARWRRRCFRR